MRNRIITLMALILMAPLTMAQMGQPGPGGEFDCPMGGGRGPGMGQGGAGHHGMMNCDGPMQGRRGGGIGRLMMVADEIGLTDEQKDQLLQLRVDFQLAQIDRKAEVKKATVRLRDLKRDDEGSVSAVNGAIDEVASLKAGLHKAMYAHRQEIKEILTDEQIEKVKALRKERFEDRSGKKMGRGQGHGWQHP
jgi:Spy/CpxP family protein refolding chaperone